MDPHRMSGAPCFRGSRLPVRQLFDWLADSVSLHEFIENFRIDRAAAEVWFAEVKLDAGPDGRPRHLNEPARNSSAETSTLVSNTTRGRIRRGVVPTPRRPSHRLR